MPGRWPRPEGGGSMIFRLSFGHLLWLKENGWSAKPMKKKIELDEETARMLDEVRGDMSASEYVDRLLKKYQGVTLPHTPDPPMNPEPDN
jgi:hypothetical protein